MITKVYAHVLDEDRKINAQKFEASFYSNPDLRTVKPPQPVTELAALIEKIQRSPELVSALAALLNGRNAAMTC